MERVETYLSTLDGAVGRLCVLRKRATSFDQFEGDLDTGDLVVHNLWVALESVLDICRYIVGRSGTSTTGVGAHDLIEKAREAGVLEPRLAARLQDMVSLKDTILHEFWRLDCQQTRCDWSRACLTSLHSG